MSARETPRNLRVFGAVLAALLAWLALRGTSLRHPSWAALTPGALALLAVAGTCLLLALAAPLSLIVIYRPWMRVARVLGRVSSTVLLGLVFFAVVTPLGLVMRLFGWDPFGLRRPRDASFWHRRDPSLDDGQRMRRLY